MLGAFFEVFLAAFLVVFFAVFFAAFFVVFLAAFLLVFVEDFEQRSRALLGFSLISLIVCIWLFYEYWRNRRSLARAMEAATQQSASAEGL